MPRQYRALVLVGAYAGLRWGEAVGLRRRDIDPMRSRIRVTSTAVELRGHVTLDNEPKTTRSKRSVPGGWCCHKAPSSAPARTSATWWCVERAPPGFCRLDELERHREAGGAGTGSLSDALAVPTVISFIATLLPFHQAFGQPTAPSRDSVRAAAATVSGVRWILNGTTS
jgi:hypothetical protein